MSKRRKRTVRERAPIGTKAVDEVRAPEPRRREIDHVLQDLPGMRSPFLATQATSIGVVDRHIENLEVQLFREYMAEDRTPLWGILVVALSQMWVFSLYELLRTWRQMANELSRYATDLETLHGKQRDDRIGRERARVKKVQSHVHMPDRSYDRCFEAVERDASFGERVKSALAATEGIFREIESLRITLAKHEVPKTGFRAEAPGYARLDHSSGSLCWMIALKDGSSRIISRRSIAERVREIGDALEIKAPDSV